MLQQKRKDIGITIFLLSLLVPIWTTAQSSQQIDQHERVKPFWNTEMRQIAEGGSNDGWVHFKPGTSIDAGNIFSDHANAFGLRTDDQMIEEKRQTDNRGNTHISFQQVYKGVVVEGALYKVHQRAEGFTYLANGRMIRDLDLEVQPAVNSAAAITSAIDDLEIEVGEDALRNAPQTQLVITRVLSGDFSKENHRLVFAVELMTQDPVFDRLTYVDAMTGEVLRSRALSMVCDAGSVTTTWNGTRDINTQSTSSGFRLEDNCGSFGGGDIHVHSNDFDSVPGSSEYYDLDNVWNAGTNSEKVSGATTLWSLSTVKEYFFDEHSMDSWNDNGADMDAYNSSFIAGSSNNACYCGGNILFGFGNDQVSNLDDWNTLDIAGHEWTHAVVDGTADLEYQWESGALNESFADIFGNVVEQWVEGVSADWLVGEDRGGAIRDMENPNDYNDPHTYLGTNYVTTGACLPSSGNDFCGVHTNSGIQNKWFQLLVDGGSGVNDNGDAYDVSGIGYSRARDIAFVNLSAYLGPTSGFLQARAGSIQAAEDLFGSCSNEALAVADAWFAVGVGPQAADWDEVVCGNYVPVLFDQIEEGISTLSAAGGVFCNVTINTGGWGFEEVIFRAADRVTLRPGFRALNYSKFQAELDPCTWTGYREGDTEYANNVPDVISEDEITADGSSSHFAVFPNPFTDVTQLQFELHTASPAVVHIYDATGRRVSEIPLPEADYNDLLSGNVQIDLSDQPAGTYLLSVETAETVFDPVRIVAVK